MCLRYLDRLIALRSVVVGVSVTASANCLVSTYWCHFVTPLSKASRPITG